MRIILWGINYAPESIGIAPFNRDLCTYLAGQGHDVAAVTTFAYYPQWRLAAADRGRWLRTEQDGAVAVHRCRCYVPAKQTAGRRVVHELTFGLLSALRILFLPRADVYVVVSPPLGLGVFAWLVTIVKRSRFVFHVQDLQPDAAVGLGMVRRGWLVRALYAIERFAYARAARVSGITEGMIAAFLSKGVPRARTWLLPNWLRPATGAIAVRPERTAARRRFGVEEATLLAVYAGNLGQKQNLPVLIEAAGWLRARATSNAPGVKLIIAGEGAARAELAAALQARPGVEVELRGLLSDDDYAMLLAAADVGLITQASGTGRYFLPSKLLSVLAAGLPVVAVADEDSELARAVRAGGCGAVVPADDAVGLAVLLQQLASERGPLADWARGTCWVEQFSRAAILPRFEAMLQTLVPEGSPRPVVIPAPKPVGAP